MFRFSRKMVYTVEAVLFIALYGKDAPVQSRTICRKQGIPERYLEQTLQRLVRSGILTGVRGPRGGYQLARSAGRISIGEIVGVIRSAEGRDDPTTLNDGSELGERIVLPLFERLDGEVMERLDRVSVADMARWAGQRSLVGEDALSALENA